MTYNPKNTQALIGALPLIAQALGDKYGIKIAMGGNTAATDGQTIVLPSLSSDDPEAAALAIGYIDHECGHVRDTDMELFEKASQKDPFLQNMLNLFEDIRIESMMGELYPGATTNLARLVKKLVIKGDFAQVDSNNPGSLVSGYLLYTLRTQILGQLGLEELAQDAATKIDAEYPGLRAELDAVSFEVCESKDTQGCYDLAESVIEAMKKYIKEPPAPPAPDNQGDNTDDQDQDSSNEDDSSSDSNSSGSDGDSDDDDNSDSDNNSGTSGSGDDNDDDADNSNDNATGGNSDSQTDDDDDSSDDSDSSGSSSGAGDSGDPDSSDQTDSGNSQQWDKEKAKTLVEALNASDDDLVQHLGEVLQEQLEEASDNIPLGYNDYDKDGFGIAEASTDESGFALNEQKVRTTTNALRVRLRSLLAASTLQRNQLSRTGRRLDHRKLHRLRAGDLRVFKSQGVKHGLNTALHILLDRSGSMRKRMPLANDTMLAVKLALHGINQVNLGISAFPSHSGGYVPLVKHGDKNASNDIGMTVTGCTPLGDALWAVGCDMAPLREDRKIILVITDGKPDSVSGTKAAISGLEKAGYETVGIGINHFGVEDYFKHSCVISNISELPKALFGEMEKLLV